jgi:hypothetical protein
MVLEAIEHAAISSGISSRVLLQAGNLLKMGQMAWLDGKSSWYGRL